MLARFFRHPAQLDLKLLFGNIESIIATSQKLLNALEAATQGKDFEQQEIGELPLHRFREYDSMF